MKQITVMKCLLNQGVLYIYKQKNKQNTKEGRKSNKIYFLVFTVSAANVVHSTY